MATTTSIESRLRHLERKKAKPPRIFVVVIGADSPRHPGEILLGGVPTAERPGRDDIVIKLEYEQAPVTNPGALASEPEPVPALASEPAPAVVVPSEPDHVRPTIDPHSRIGKAYGVGDPWRRRRYHTPADE